MAGSEEMALVPSEGFALPAALTEPQQLEEFKAAIQEAAVSDRALLADRVKFPTAGMGLYRLPTAEDEEGEPVKEMAGVVLDQQTVRAYWPGAFAGGGPPSCSSSDGVRGYGDPGGDCATCPFAQWGSAPGKGNEEAGRGQACKLMRRLWVLLPGQTLPILLSLPPTSIRAWESYTVRLLRNGAQSPRDVVTRVGLKRASSADNIEYHEATFLKLANVPPERRAALRAYASFLSPYLRAAPITEEYDIPPEEEGLEDQPKVGLSGPAEGAETDNLPF